MNTLHVVSGRPEAFDFFLPVGKIKDWTVKITLAPKRWDDLPEFLPGDFIYLELPDAPAGRKKLLEAMKNRSSQPWGLWDPAGLCSDPSLWFFEGASDYLGPGIPKLLSSRFLAAVSWAGQASTHSGAGTPDFWDSIKAETEYDFAFCLVHWDESDILKKKIGEIRFSAAWKGWRTLAESLALERGGRLWMESGTTLVFLFPPQKDRSPVFSFAMKILISHRLHTLEVLGLEICPALKVALHKGLCTYRKPGETGTIISDAVNSVFHLGLKYAPENRAVFTAPLLEDLPAALIPLSQPLGTFENRQIYRLPGFS